MRRLIMWNVLTLDGYFEGPKSWDLEFHNEVWGDELERFSIEQLHTAEMLVFGRVTYTGMAAYWRAATGAVADLMNAIPKVVYSRSLAAADWNNTTLVKEDAAAAMPRLKREGSGDMFVFGSANLSATLTREGLFDEYRLLVAPVMLGEGHRLFAPGSLQRAFRLLESRPLASGGVILRYVPR